MTNLQGLTSISWEKDGQPGLAFKKEGDTWYYQSDKDCPIRQYTVTTLADTLARLSAGRQLETPDSLDSYGLNPPAVKFSMTSEDGTSQTLMIGNQVAGTYDTAAGYASTAAEYYACLEGGSQVYTIGNYLTETSGKGLYDFVETESLPYVAGTDIKEITVTRNGATRVFSKRLWMRITILPGIRVLLMMRQTVSRIIPTSITWPRPSAGCPSNPAPLIRQRMRNWEATDSPPPT